MSRIVYINGRYMPATKAVLPLEDRSIFFGDSIYEVIYFKDGVYIDMEAHIKRLSYSLEQTHISLPCSISVLKSRMYVLLRYNRLLKGEGYIYIQITRGCAQRQHAYKSLDLFPSLIMTLTPLSKPVISPMNVMTAPDGRWSRPDIKTTNLLYNIMATQEAVENGGEEVWFLNKDGHVTEGGRMNAWIVKEGRLYTYPASNYHILRGITRERFLKLALHLKIPVEEKPFSLKNALEADEAFNTSTTYFLRPIAHINHQKIGSICPGPIAKKLYEAYIMFLNREAKNINGRNLQ